MVAVLGGQFAIGDGIDDLDSRHNLHWERERCFPARLRTLLVSQVELRRGSIADARHRPKVIVHLRQQVRFCSTCEIQEKQVGVCIVRGIAAPENTADATSQQINQAHSVTISKRWRATNNDALTPRVATLIDPQRDVVVVNIDHVCKAVAIDISHQDAL